MIFILWDWGVKLFIWQSEYRSGLTVICVFKAFFRSLRRGKFWIFDKLPSYRTP